MPSNDPITQLQENQLFLDRRLDELHEAILAISERLERANRTMSQLERRLDALVDGALDGDQEDGPDPFESSQDAS